ncbi:TetR/AcrR family transcriptional regulator [Bacterioplanoides sp.]|uniref:TetR/AcrR family transcriptional regulator n=1 Tax=Bacterioplanoides sp. TaxID=2066072 RepID=UPI003B59CC9D
MPKKPFTAEEIVAQRQRIMDSASSVMAEVGFHHLSMRKLASQLGMTASNIYNYFPNKESLFIHTRCRGFELAFLDINEQLRVGYSPQQGLLSFASNLVAFAQRFPGYYQLMFQPPLLSLEESDLADQEVQHQLGRLVDEWQQHAQTLLVDAIPELVDQPESRQKQMTLFVVASLHGLIDTYRYQALPGLVAETELISQDMVTSHVSSLLISLRSTLETRVQQAAAS